jgi:hypothetical protein
MDEWKGKSSPETTHTCSAHKTNYYQNVYFYKMYSLVQETAVFSYKNEIILKTYQYIPFLENTEKKIS